MDFCFGNIESPYSCNNLYFTKNGEAVLPIAGEIHFSRVPKKYWKRELLKMKDCGITVISNYVFWNHHQRQADKFDFKGDNDIAAFLGICKEVGLPVILRIGPWCHGEVRTGGFPDFINRLPGKRSNDPKYLGYVKTWWNRLAREIQQYFDGETVFGVQLENEFEGKIEHIRALRKIAEEAGFKTPFFTMTAWPGNEAHKDFLPMCGGYPEAPWTQHKRPLEPKNRFVISAAKTEADIGEDLNKIKKGNDDVFADFPYASCELGPGNQVTQHRRPIISEKDGYGIGFSRFASGMNLIGYYMFHGGKNPLFEKPMQESRITGYPNNYPIIDYDFQSPVGRYGACRAHGDRLRLMHLFINTFDNEIAKKQPFFPKEKRCGCNDISMPSCSVRMQNDGSGYFFACAYERGLEFNDYMNTSAEIVYPNGKISLPPINIKNGAMFFYPFNLQVESIKFDYITAQPVTKTLENGKTVCWFSEIAGVKPEVKINGETHILPLDEIGYDENGVQIIVLSDQKAKHLHSINGKVIFADGTVYCNGDAICCETSDGYLDNLTADKNDLSGKIRLFEMQKAKLPYGYYLYSYGKRKYYMLQIDSDILNNCFDVELTFNFTGLNLQLFCGKQLIDDYFNTDGKYVIRLGEFEDYIKSGKNLIIKTVPPTSFGAGCVYNEINLKAGENTLEFACAREVFRLQTPAV